ncbi:MAG: LPS translocon maturation chaperone LptM [Alcanivoracaceae bacterium]
MRTLVILIVTLMLAGCGQKGSLYFPPPSTSADAPANAPAATDDTPSESDGP